MLKLLVSVLEIDHNNFLPTESSPKHTNHDGNLCFFTLVSQNHQKTTIRPLIIQNQWCCRAALPGSWEVQAAFPSHTTEMHLCWKTLACFLPSFPADSKHLLPAERKSKPNCVQPHPLPACLQHQPSLCYLLTDAHPQAKTAPKSSPSCPSTGTWRVGLMTLTKAVAEIPVLLLKADVEECMDTQNRQQRFIRIRGCVTKGSYLISDHLININIKKKIRKILKGRTVIRILCPSLPSPVSGCHNTTSFTKDPSMPFAYFFPSLPGILFPVLPPAIHTQQDFHGRFTFP